jgi:hypothetical protein
MSLRKSLKEQLSELESFRSEKKNFDSGPLPINRYSVPDWSESGMRIQLGMHHLDESLPNGQLARTTKAYLLARQGIEDLGSWLRLNGVDV